MSGPLGPGDVFAGHLIDALAGGAVYRAIHTGSERRVALKLDSAAPGDLPAHPNVLPVYETGEAEGRRYVSMRWVEGPTLAELLSVGALEAGHARAIAGQVAAALAAAHARGIAHGALKPSNVLLEGDHAYLSDFSGRGTPPEDLRALAALRAAMAGRRT
jgi:serine/threonine protein kinase